MPRLQRCGVANVLYVVEGQLEKVRALEPAAIQSAVAGTQLEDNFIVVHSPSLNATIEHIVMITEAIEKVQWLTNYDVAVIDLLR